jgi:hypothetical protein
LREIDAQQGVTENGSKIPVFDEEALLKEG